MLHRFRQSRFVQDVALPWATSIAVHALIVATVVLMVRTLVVISRADATEEQPVLPAMEIAVTEMPAGTAEQPLGPGISERLPAQDEVDARNVNGFASEAGDAFDLTNAGRDPGPTTPNFIGLSPLEPGGKPGADGNEPGGGRGGPLAPFGPPGGGTPDGTPFTPGKPVASVAYVCDASGSMIDKFSLLREQLAVSVAGLKPVQSFNVIFFRDERAAALSDKALLTGVPDHKRRAEKFLDDVTAAGTTDPLPALELAFRQKPELIFLLTDGDFPNNDAVLAFIRRHNPGGRVRINTIAFVERGDGYERVLKQIAEENRGTFTHYAGDAGNDE